MGANSQALRLGSLLAASSESQLTDREPDDVYVDISEVCDEVASTEKTEEEEEEAEEEMED
jgi:transcription elongation factor Elf1